MEMESIWVNVTQVLDMAKAFICSKMALVMKGTGSKAKGKAGVFTNTQMALDILESIKLASEKVSVCMNTSHRKDTKVIGNVIRKMAMESPLNKMERWKQAFIRTMYTLGKP